MCIHSNIGPKDRFVQPNFVWRMVFIIQFELVCVLKSLATTPTTGDSNSNQTLTHNHMDLHSISFILHIAKNSRCSLLALTMIVTHACIFVYIKRWIRLVCPFRLEICHMCEFHVYCCCCAHWSLWLCVCEFFCSLLRILCNCHGVRLSIRCAASVDSTERHSGFGKFQYNWTPKLIWSTNETQRLV